MKYTDFVKEVFKVKNDQPASAKVKQVVMNVAPNVKSLAAPQIMKVAGKCWKSFKK